MRAHDGPEQEALVVDLGDFDTSGRAELSKVSWDGRGEADQRPRFEVRP